MLKTVKLRVLGQHIDSRKGLNDDELTDLMVREAKKIASKDHVLSALDAIDPDVDRRNLKWIILFNVLLQEETYSLEERRLEEKVIEFEKSIVERAKSLDFFDKKKHDAVRWHHYDTYRIVLEAAWRNDDDISADEAQLLRALRAHLSISMEEHWLISTYINRFPKKNRGLHTPDDVHEARKKLQRESLLWSYRDEVNRNHDVIPVEVVKTLRYDVAGLQLQDTNYYRVLQHDNVKLADLRGILIAKGMDRYGNKEELIHRIVRSDLAPAEVLEMLDKPKLAEMCRQVGLSGSGSKPGLIERLIDFYDDLTFEERTTKDDREVHYNNFELLAARRYSDLKAKKLISKDLDIEHFFEAATVFLFERKLGANVDKKGSGRTADGRILLDGNFSMLWDCKSVERQVNLHDHLDSQFDVYLRREQEKGYNPLAFLVIGPDFTPQSLKLAHQYKARTNWDIALVTASGLRHLAESWSTAEPNKPFPIRLFNRTELIDKEKAELLLSLA
ncbi:MAG: hypothetical protein EA376_14170 [Phycisphaeraceae bacterium]|nr:MAG: hypothetical protein EA376_14170 [Phycisphaeraceae bacterium]